MKFRTFLENTDHAYLGQKIGDVLTSLHELEEDMGGMGMRHLEKNAEQVVQQIRRILHSNWPKEEMKYLYSLQKSGVAIMKAIEEKDDLKSVLSGVKTELEGISTKLGVPQNSLATQNVEPSPVPQGVSKPEDKKIPQESQPPKQQGAQPPLGQQQPPQNQTNQPPLQ